ncbi:hypothetical protein D621_00710 [beta proteobacterium AAP51]|nr:hypothetical protein D621_00710 [beta proteobacterium AAP51]
MKNSLLRWLACVAAVMALCFGTAARAAAPADILWVVDTSGSMGDDIAEVKARIQDFHNAMLSAGIDARYALVRFGGNDTLIQNVTTFADFNRAGGPFRTLTANGGGTERGSNATLVGLQQGSFRPGAVINVIVVTDEDDDSTAAQYTNLTNTLRARSALFNFIGVPGVGNTDARYGLLASSFGGKAFRINEFRSNPQPFFTSFIATKVQEIINALQCDVDLDRDIDRDDINLIFAARNQPADGLADPRDADRNGVINALDARQCTLKCTRTNCQTGTPNTAPEAQAGPDQSVEVGSTVTLDGSASIDLNGQTLSYRWRLVSAPIGSTTALSDITVVRPTFVADLLGTYSFSLVVNDGFVDSPADFISVEVTPRTVATPALVGLSQTQAQAQLQQAGLLLGTVSFASSSTVPAGIVLAQTPAAGLRAPLGSAVALTVSIGLQVPVPVLTNLTQAEAEAAITAAGLVVGNITSVSSSTVPAGRVVATSPPVGSGVAPGSAISLVISSGPDTTPPQAALSSPTPGSQVAGRVSVVGTASDANLVRWTLELSVAGDANWQTLGTGTTSVVDAELGSFDTGTLASNFYRLRLTVADAAFSRSVTADVQVDNRLQLGRFELVYTDLQVPNLGVAINLVRSYDSSQLVSGDFGRSWRLGLTEADIREDANKNVYITLPDGRRRAFAFTPVQLSPFFPGSAPRYTPAAGVYDRLEAVECSLVVLSGGRWFCFPGSEYDPDTYLLTTKEGLRYTISQSQGIRRVEDAAGNFVSIDAGGISSSSGRNVVFERDTANRIVAITDPRGARLSYTYDAAGRLVAVTDATGAATGFQYLGDSVYISAIVTSGGCQPLRNEYGVDGRLSASLDAEGRRTTFEYGADGRSKRVVDPLGASTLYEYDARGNVVRETGPEGQVTQRSFDANDRLTALVQPGGLRTDYTYDSQGNWVLARQLRSDGVAVEYRRSFNSFGRLERYTAPTGARLDFTYDAAQNPQQLLVRGDDGNVGTTVLFNYDAAGRLLSTTVNGSTWTYTYDSFGNLLGKTEPSGGVTQYSHDANGNVTSETLPDGTVNSFAFDALNRIVEEARNGALLRRIDYDSEGRPIKVTEGEGGETRFSHSCIGRLTAVEDAAGNTTAYSYDSANRLAGVQYANGLTRSYAYTPRGYLAQRTDTDGAVHGLTQNADGLLTALFSPRHPAGQAQLQYDNLQQLVSVSRPDFAVNATLDRLGRVVSATEGPPGAARTLAITYGPQGEPVVVNENGRELRSVYDGQGLRTELRTPDGTVTRYTYDGQRRLVGVETLGRGSVSFQYDTTGRRVRADRSNGSYTTYGYVDNQLQVLAHFDASGALISRHELDRTPNGYSRSVVWADGRADYSYDALWRLTREQRSSSSLGNADLSFSYDAVGNRLDAGALLQGNRLLQWGGDTLGYDANGNVVSRGADTYSYDSLNRLVGHSRGGVSTSYTYDGRERRIRKASGSEVREFLYDGQQVVAEYGSSGQLLARYTHALGLDEVLMQHRGADTYHYHADPQGSIVAITNAAGQVVQRYGYDAWGRLVLNQGSFAFSGSGLVNTRTYIGREYDEESGLYHLRARAYDAQLGRFLQKDPQQGQRALPQSQHPYAYALNSPTNFVDPTGESVGVEYSFMLKSGRWNSAGALIGFMQGFVTPTYSFLGEFFGALNEAGPRADVDAVIESAFTRAEAQVSLIENQISKLAGIDPYTFASSYVSGLNYKVGFEIKLTGIPKPVKQALSMADIPTSAKLVEIEIVPSQGGFKNGTKQGFNYLRQILHLPQ